MCFALTHNATSRPLWSTQHLPIDSSSLWEPQCLPIDSSAWQTVRALHTMIHGAQHWPQIPQMVRMVLIFTTIISWGQHYQLCQSSTAVSFNRSRPDDRSADSNTDRLFRSNQVIANKLYKEHKCFAQFVFRCLRNSIYNRWAAEILLGRQISNQWAWCHSHLLLLFCTCALPRYNWKQLLVRWQKFFNKFHRCLAHRQSFLCTH